MHMAVPLFTKHIFRHAWILLSAQIGISLLTEDLRQLGHKPGTGCQDNILLFAYKAFIKYVGEIPVEPIIPRSHLIIDHEEKCGHPLELSSGPNCCCCTWVMYVAALLPVLGPAP